jgi:competence ComEA-like helix-hairpin-helix protein
MRAILSLVALLSAGIALAQDIVLPDGKAKSVIENACTECHGLDQVVSNPMSAKDWRATVNRMVKKGATLSPEEIDSVVEYLSVYFVLNKVNVNKATAKDLETGLQISPAEAAAIVKYRDANGDFKDFVALAKVSGLDQKKIAGKKDLIDF